MSLVWQPARWVAALRPRWVALEQVPAVLPLWEAMARALEVHGYRCWTGVLSAERYGVPQTRKRAILLASLDCQPQPPEATHQAYVPGEPARAGEPDLFGPGLHPWVDICNGRRPIDPVVEVLTPDTTPWMNWPGLWGDVTTGHIIRGPLTHRTPALLAASVGARISPKGNR